MARVLPVFKMLPTIPQPLTISIKGISSPLGHCLPIVHVMAPKQMCPLLGQVLMAQAHTQQASVRWFLGLLQLRSEKLLCNVRPSYGNLSDSLLQVCDFYIITGDLFLQETRRLFSIHNHKELFFFLKIYL